MMHYFVNCCDDNDWDANGDYDVNGNFDVFLLFFYDGEINDDDDLDPF